MDVDVDLPSSRRLHVNSRVRCNARGSHGRVRQELAAQVIFQAARMSFLHSKLFLETVNLATDLPRFVQEHLSINPAALCRREVHLAKESS